MNRSGEDERWKFIGGGILLLLLAAVFPNTLLAYAVTAFIGIFAFLKPKESLFLLLFYFPLRSFLTEVNPALKLAGDLIIIAAFLRVVWEARRHPKTLFQFEIFEWAFIIFLIVGAVSGFLTGVGLGAIIFQLRAFVITFLLLYIVKRLGVTREDIKVFLWMTFWVAFILVVQGLVEKVSLRSAWMPEAWINRQLSPNNASRIYGLINNPNVLAVFLTIAAVLTVYLKMMLPKNKLQWLLNAGLVLMAGVWILTYSRGTWIAFVIALFVYLVYSRNWQFFLKTAGVMALAFVFVAAPTTYATEWLNANTEVGKFERTGPPEEVAAPAPPSSFETESTRIKETFDANTFEKSLSTGRLYVVWKGFEIFLDHPVIGTGFATFGDSATKTYSSPIYEHYGIGTDIYSDNQYIQIITQTGVIGVILFAVFLLGLLAMFWKNRKRTPHAIPLVAGLIAVYWCGLIYNIWEDKTFTMYFYFITGAFLLLVTDEKKPLTGPIEHPEEYGEFERREVSTEE